jgi:hypothetical protein
MNQSRWPELPKSSGIVVILVVEACATRQITLNQGQAVAVGANGALSSSSIYSDAS